MTRNAAPASTNSYTLSSAPAEAKPPASWRHSPAPAAPGDGTAKRLARLCRRRRDLVRRTAGPAHHQPHDRHLHPDRGLRRRPALRVAALAVFLLAFVTTYVQTQTMGSVGRRVLFALRNTLFTKLQQLPLDFFNQNKAGDLISRINNDTDKLNQFFSQSLVQLAANLFMMAGAAIFLVALNVRLGLAALAPALGVFLRHAPDRPVGQAAERQEPAVARRAERRDPGEPRQLQGHRRVQPPRLFPPEVRRGQRAHVRRVGGIGPGQQRVHAALRAGVQPGADRRAALRHPPDRDGQPDGRPADRLPDVREQLLHAAAAAGGRVDVVSAGARRTGPRLGGARARIEHAGELRRHGAWRHRAAGVRARRLRLSRRQARCCTTPRSRSSAERPTRWSGRPAAARRRRRR